MRSVLIAGSGGQGILFLGKLIAHAAMLEGKHVTWFPSYGAEMRGGTANCTVVIAEEAIGSPVVASPDVLVLFNHASKVKFEGRLKAGGLMLMDSSLISSPPERDDVRAVLVPATGLAASLDNSKAANMVLLGALISEGLVGEKSAMTALEELAFERRKSALDINKSAVRKGMAFRGAKES